MEQSLLAEIVTVLGLAIFIVLVCRRVRVPPIVGFLLTGVLAGPHCLSLVKSEEQVHPLAEVGVVLLLFTIGIEFSLRGLLRIRRLVFVGGALQVLFTVGATALGAIVLGRPPHEALFWGWLISLSSTAIVLKVLQEKAEVDTPHGGTILGIMIFQDIVAVPMVLFTPLLAGTAGGGGGWTMLLLAGKGVAVVLLALAAAKWIVPRVMFEVTRTRSRETFLLAVVVICLATAWGTNAAGLSIALGAFLAGLVVSESEYNHQALGSILPFKDVFTSFFFISIGMLLDLSFCAEHPVGTVLLLLAVIAVKTVFGAVAALTLRLPLRTALLTGVGVAQVGEFAFVLSRIGVELRLLSPEGNQVFLAASVLSMAATPPLLALAIRLAGRAGPTPAGAPAAPAHGPGGEGGHLLIVGYGVNGRNVARAARLAGIAYEIVEMNAETVKRERAQGEPITYGDATHEAVLSHVRAHSARVAVVAINDAAATRRIVECLRRVNPRLRLIVRTRFTTEIEPLRRLGADEVIPEEFETSVEIFTRVLARFLVPRHEIERFVSVIRAEGYEMLRGLSPATALAQGLGLDLPDVEVCALRVAPGSPFAGRSLEAAALRREHGVTVLAVRREGKTDSNPAGATVLSAGDLLVVLGAPDRVRELASLLGHSSPPSRQP